MPLPSSESEPRFQFRGSSTTTALLTTSRAVYTGWPSASATTAAQILCEHDTLVARHPPDCQLDRQPDHQLDRQPDRQLGVSATVPSSLSRLSEKEKETRDNGLRDVAREAFLELKPRYGQWKAKIRVYRTYFALYIEGTRYQTVKIINRVRWQSVDGVCPILLDRDGNGRDGYGGGAILCIWFKMGMVEVRYSALGLRDGSTEYPILLDRDGSTEYSLTPFNVCLNLSAAIQMGLVEVRYSAFALRDGSTEYTLTPFDVYLNPSAVIQMGTAEVHYSAFELKYASSSSIGMGALSTC
ncbi:hypothetical protein C8J55DRAFT_489406 [Lentinula edodes]|uniref:Uncharacterized protein n=1 Tax=Lentinula lateritia TaxID=40482 RepID=A0A9W9ACV5_9AGAR|nr:hypothetical protein C8J55DRAFT_489406 [Lentinula edodes]